MFSWKLVKQIVPPLTGTLHKGQLGKIAVIGGCREYTGAPFYAGMAAQRVGADLVTIMCSEEAGIPIKCYSPELIVCPVIQLKDCAEESDQFKQVCEMNYDSVVALLERIDSVVIGPGAGRHPVMIHTLEKVISFVIEKNKPLVIDGDGLWVVTRKPSLLSGAKKVILTPNQMEFTRLWNSVMHDTRSPDDLNSDEFVTQLSSHMGGVTILQKGAIDRVAEGDLLGRVTEQGAPRRCGGQGDVVAGVMGVMNLWSYRSRDLELSPGVTAGMATAKVVKEAAARAYAKEKRGMTAMSLVKELPDLIDEVCESLFVSLRCLLLCVIYCRVYSIGV